MKQCKQCGHEIVPGGRMMELIAQELGYCGSGCRALEVELREFEQRLRERYGYES